MIRIWEVDPHTRERTREVDLAFRPGSFQWGPGTLRHDSCLEPIALGGPSFGLTGRSRVVSGRLQPARRSVPVRGEAIPAGIGAGRDA